MSGTIPELMTNKKGEGQMKILIIIAVIAFVVYRIMHPNLTERNLGKARNLWWNLATTNQKKIHMPDICWLWHYFPVTG